MNIVLLREAVLFSDGLTHAFNLFYKLFTTF
jgi:hypothetical protein